jgi:radical SAM superfamily enzyme YgiQ (UPF0313 family)
MRILLVRPEQPLSTRGLRHITVCEPLELEYLAAAVPGHEVRVLDLLLGDDLQSSLIQFRPQLVGTTCYINNVPQAIEVCALVKAFDPTIRTLLGGVHAVVNPGDFAHPAVDIVVHGEGMAVLRELVPTMEAGDALDRVAGICLNTSTGLKNTGLRPFPADVAGFPMPDRNVVKLHRDDYHYMDIRPLAIMKTSWGCPYACTFCYNRELVGGRYYARPAEAVVAEIESLYAPHVFIVDDVFFCERRRALEIYDLIKARGIRKEYAAYCRADFIVRNEDVLRAWRDIGLRVLRVGMEAINDGELRDYNKRISSECNLEAVEVCRRLGLELSASFLIRPDYGKRNFTRLRAYVLRTGLTHVFLNPLTPLPGTALHEQLKNDIIADHRRMAPLWDFQHSVLKPTKLSLKSFYHQMGMTYLMAVNPFRPRKLVLRRFPPLSAVWKLIRILWEVFRAHKDHDLVANEDRLRGEGESVTPRAVTSEGVAGVRMKAGR